MVSFSKSELIILHAALRCYINYLSKSNHWIKRRLGILDSKIDCDDKQLIIDLAQTVLDKINEQHSY